MDTLYALTILATLLATAWSIQCHVPDDLVSDCGHVNTDQGQCESSGCCWNPDVAPGKPWCFYPLDQCSVAYHQKKDCGIRDQQKCEGSGCCWRKGTHPGEPWCYKAESPSPSPPTPPTPTPPTPTPGIMKGMGYAPVPLKHTGDPPHDDFFCEASKPLWGPGGRDDLRIMAGLGVNFVRLYGNDPRYGHTEFLEYAKTLGISAFIGFSDWIYNQDPDGNCVAAGFNCYPMVKAAFKTMLKGLIVPGTNQYHPAIKYIALSNEPDQKYSGNAYKMMISAFDAVIDAEKELGVVAFEGQDPPKFTATFTFGGYGNSCGPYSNVPGLGQMANLQCAMKNPGQFEYQPNNNIGELYESRFINSFNTQNTPSDSDALHNFTESYKEFFGFNAGTGHIPVFIGEYHRLPADGGRVERDLNDILKIAADPSSPLIGINFFEFQVRHDKSWERERGFGMFDLGNTKVGEVPMEDAHGNWLNFTVWCLSNVWDSSFQGSIADAVHKSYGGPGLNTSVLCPRMQDTVRFTDDSATIVV